MKKTKTKMDELMDILAKPCDVSLSLKTQTKDTGFPYRMVVEVDSPCLSDTVIGHWKRTWEGAAATMIDELGNYPLTRHLVED